MSSNSDRSVGGSGDGSDEQHDGGLFGRVERSMEPLPEDDRTVPDPLLALFAAVPIGLVAEVTAREQWATVSSLPKLVSVVLAIAVCTAVLWWLSLATGEGARWGRRFALASGVSQGCVLLIIAALRLFVGDAAFRLEFYESSVASSVALAGGLFAVFAAIFSFGALLTWLVAER